jgi:HprK-related kinase A
MSEAQRIGALGEVEIRDRLSGPGLALDFGFVKARVRSDVPGLGEAIQRVYAEFPVADADGFFDVTASVTRAGGLRRFVRPQIEFFVDGTQPFEPFPADTHLPLLEWGLNWCIAQRSNTHLLLHAGVVEKNGLGIVLPALPGSGKSTLVAALIARGYRLLSDEFGVVRQSDGMLLPLLKPVALKDASIDVIRRFAPASALGPVFPKTRKGDVAHLAPPAASTARRHEPAAPALILFPQFAAGEALALEPMPKSRAFAKVSANSFNYGLLGRGAFLALGRMVERCDVYRLSYGDLDEAIVAIDGLMDGLAGGAASR